MMFVDLRIEQMCCSIDSRRSPREYIPGEQGRSMSANLWFKDDIRNILVSVNVSSAATAQCESSAVVSLYRRGYQSAVMAVALACGIPPEEVGIRRDTAEFRESPSPSDAWLREIVPQPAGDVSLPMIEDAETRRLP
jgi:hypothetical protein